MRRIDSLTSLRMVAALAIFVHHCIRITEDNILQNPNMHRISVELMAGVTFFFVLSGFIITYSFKSHLHKGSFDRFDFLFFRFARLYPTHLATLVLAALVYTNFGAFFSAQLVLPSIADIFLVQSWIPDFSYNFSFNGVAWSISDEIFFYASFCLLALFPMRTVSSIFVALLVVIIAASYFDHDPSRDTSWLFYVNPAFRIFDFIAGMLTYHIYSSRRIAPSFTQATAFELLALLALVVTAWLRLSVIPVLNEIRDISYVPAFCLIVLAFSLNTGALSRLLQSPRLVLLGHASFSFYMIHQLVLNLTYRLHPVHDMSSALIAFATAFLVCIIASIFIFRYFEQPANRVLRNFWLSKRKGGQRPPKLERYVSLS